MKTDILSLKNLYQFLTVNDYPVYSEGIISRKNHTGFTLTKFWQENILFDFRNRKCGKQIWRSGKARNRYASDICNRNERLGCYGEYAEELCNAANQETVLRQIQQFMNMLVERKYNYEVFCQKLPVFIRLVSEGDESFSADALRFFETALKEEQSFDSKGNEGRAFFCGWFLTMLMLHALSGNGEGESALRRLRDNPGLSLKALSGLSLKSNMGKKKKAAYLTSKNSELCAAPLSRQHFFGREEELFELREMLISGGKYLISGIGGIGKTELMRQLIQCCEEEALADYICVIQYEGSLMASFVKAFPQIHGTKMKDNFSEALACIRAHEGERVLIVIDNMNVCEDDQLAVLKMLSATVFITSRCRKLNGFTSYPVGLIGKNAGNLIFRDSYEKALTEEDKKALSEILEDDIWRHTLTLRLLGRAAAARGWTMGELKQRLEQGIIPAAMQEQDVYEGLHQMYRRIYGDAGLKKMNGLLQVFAVLPHQSYTAEFAKRFLAGFMEGGMAIEESLEKLYVIGRLEKHENGYSMHPFMAECVRSGGIREKGIAPFVEAVAKAWGGYEKDFNVKLVLDMLMEWEANCGNFDEELLQTIRLIPSVVLSLTGKCSKTLSELVLVAYVVLYNSVGTSRAETEKLTMVKKKLGHLGEEAAVVLCLLLCMYGCRHGEELERDCSALLESPTVGRGEKALLIGQLGLMYYRLGNLEKIEQMANALEEYEGEEHAREIACFLRVIIMREQGDLKSYKEWLLKGYEAGKREGRMKGWIMREILTALANLYYSGRQFEKAEYFLQEFEDNLEEQSGTLTRMTLLYYRGGLALFREDEGYGIEQLEGACRLAKNCWSGVDDGSYAMFLAELAMAYNKAGRREEAAETYQQTIALLENRPGYEFDRYRTINNMSVMYLDWGKPDEALSWLEKVRPVACGMGGIGLAESGYNLSKAWRQLGDREKELQYLKEAAPLLEQFYGGEHPKVIDAKERLADSP